MGTEVSEIPDSCTWEVYSLVGVTDTGGISVERGNFSDVGTSRALWGPRGIRGDTITGEC